MELGRASLGATRVQASALLMMCASLVPDDALGGRCYLQMNRHRLRSMQRTPPRDAHRESTQGAIQIKCEGREKMTADPLPLSGACDTAENCMGGREPPPSHLAAGAM